MAIDATVLEVGEELEAHRVRYEAFCRALSAEQLQRPVPRATWLVRDFIAHLATIDVPVGEMFRTMHEGGEPGIRSGDGARWDVDEWNEAQIQARRGKTVDEILAEAVESRAELLKHMNALSAEDLAKNIKFAGDARRPPAEYPLGAYLKGWCKHDPMHALDMSRALPEMDSPELQQWFADPVVQGYQAMMNREAAV